MIPPQIPEEYAALACSIVGPLALLVFLAYLPRVKYLSLATHKINAWVLNVFFAVGCGVVAWKCFAFDEITIEAIALVGAGAASWLLSRKFWRGGPPTYLNRHRL